jgi:hypothetical protein
MNISKNENDMYLNKELNEVIFIQVLSTVFGY